VKDYGQRDYRKLAAQIGAALKQKISIEFSDDLAESMALASPGQEVIVIGEQSLVVRDAKKAALKYHPICALTDLDGMTTLTGSFVVRAADPAKDLKDIGGRTMFLGLVDTDENRAVTQASLRTAGIESPAAPQKRASYGDAALDVLDSQSSPPPVGVIPSYSLRLLEGCGSVKPGELRVIGKTAPVPFITVFVANSIPEEKEQRILETLLGVKGDAKLLKAMESRDGFKAMKEKKSDGPQANEGWPDWRGPRRDAHVPRLPAQLPEKAKFVWKKAAMIGGLAGLSVSGGRLILAERDFGDEHDVYRCLNADTGELLWRVEFPALGTLDYGQSPRATPVIRDDRAYLLGAFGELRCVNITTENRLATQLPREFKAETYHDGACFHAAHRGRSAHRESGAKDASLVALDCATARTRWTTPGFPAAYSSFICGEFGGRRQIVGYDRSSLGGWDVKTGERLWKLVPPNEGDFNVPTPVAVDGGLIVSTENNGTRLYRFNESGRIIPKPAAEFADLSSDTMSPVVTCGRVFGAHQGLHCLDVQNGLAPIWHRADDSLGDYATLIADEERVLVITVRGELILLDAKADACTIISRLRIFDEDEDVYSHPAPGGDAALRGAVPV
jgi:outer membrane protein assembly factor BamB/ABC-type phosphate/phosphonate transport system substrate-binding protein